MVGHRLKCCSAFGAAWVWWVVERVTSVQVLELYWMCCVAELMCVCQERRSMYIVSLLVC